MIDLHTGAPGDGKTLYTLSLVEARRLKEKRPVFYHGIRDLKLPWILLDDPHKWYECPPGAIIVLDECQLIFVPRPNGSPIPIAESKLQTHRHQGHDLYLITQDPTMLPAHLRKLVDTHKHLMRKFGSRWVTVHQFKGTRDNVSKSRKDSIETNWSDDKKMYEQYKSAEVITQRLRVPWKVWLTLLLPVGLIAGAWYFYSNRLAVKPVPPPVSTTAPAVSGAVQNQNTTQKKTYDLEAFTPRLEGLPHTAPRYDDLTVPVRVPVIAGCVWMHKQSKGHCYSQQGTRIAQTETFIKQFIERGMFEDFDRGSDLGASGSSPAPNDSTPITKPPPRPIPSPA